MKTLGTVKRNGRQWEVTCEPHVTIRLKRVFGKLANYSNEVHCVSDTAENARDLEWFIERYPLEMSNPDRLYLTLRASEHKEQATLVEEMLSKRTPPPEFDLAVPAREYQRIAAALALRTGGLLLADELGLGKSCSAICTLTDPRTLPALIVTLTHLPKQWQAELNKFAPHLTTHVLKGTTPYNLARMNGHKERNGGKQKLFSFADKLPDVVITNYHKLAGWSDTLSKVCRSVIFDEAHELRRSGDHGEVSKKYGAAKQISDNVDFRLGLTGTPIFNYGGEFFTVLDCIRPGALGSHPEFVREWCGGWTYEERKLKIDDPKAFGAYLRDAGLMLRRTREDVGRELPPLTKVAHYIDADTDTLERVSKSCADLARLILAQGESFRGQKRHASEELSNKLRQATGIAKAVPVAEFVKLLVESGERVLLYGWHRDVYSIWRDVLKEFNPVMFTGSESPIAKEKSKQAFLSGDSKVLMMSLRAGAGIDGLQGVARTVVFGELDWSPGVHDQCAGRLHRDGQEDKVVAYYLISESGSDPIVADVLGLKRAQLTGVRDPNAELIERLESGQDHIKKLAAGYLAQVEGKSKKAGAK